MGPDSTIIPVDRDGLIDEAALGAVLAEGPALVAIQHVNNETGVIQPIERLVTMIREAGSLSLVDCAQSAGKLPLPDADFIAACAHKLGGPPGVGVLLVRDLGTLDAVGGQEKGYRRGTQDAPNALAFAAALKARPYDMDRLAALRARLEDESARRQAGSWSPKQRRASPTIGAYRHARRREREPARAIRPRRYCRVGGQRLLVGRDEGAATCSPRWRCRPRSPAVSSASASARHQRCRHRPLPWRMAADGRARPGGMIYLDYQATTPLAPEVAKAMQPWIEEKFANPHSPSRWGNEAEAAIEVARKQVERAMGLKGGSVAFTGSATEALNWALKGSVEKAPKGRNRIITVATEHAAVLDTCEWLAGQGVDLTVLPVKPDGRLDLDLLARELDERVRWSRSCRSIMRLA